MNPEKSYSFGVIPKVDKYAFVDFSFGCSSGFSGVVGFSGFDIVSSFLASFVTFIVYVSVVFPSSAVTLIVISGNFLQMMNDVIEVANDLEITYKTVVSPSILFNDLSISGE